MSLIVAFASLAALIWIGWFVISELRFWRANGRKLEDSASRKSRWRRKGRILWIAELIFLFWL
ncbi:MAG: hypothetical protein ABI459_07595 [Deltaproteobacteria bacterium]